MRLSFTRVTPCEDCPWRKDAPLYRLPPAHFERMRESCDVGFGALYPCHRSPDVCASYLLSQDSLNNYNVRNAMRRHHFDSELLSSAVDLYPGYVAMAAANGVKVRLRSELKRGLPGKRPAEYKALLVIRNIQK